MPKSWRDRAPKNEERTSYGMEKDVKAYDFNFKGNSVCCVFAEDLSEAIEGLFEWLDIPAETWPKILDRVKRYFTVMLQDDAEHVAVQIEGLALDDCGRPYIDKKTGRVQYAFSSLERSDILDTEQ